MFFLESYESLRGFIYLVLVDVFYFLIIIYNSYNFHLTFLFPKFYIKSDKLFFLLFYHFLIIIFLNKYLDWHYKHAFWLTF